MKLGRRASTKWNLIFLYSDLIISLANGFLIIPLYLKFIPSTLYGAWLATGSVLMWLTLFDPGVGDVLIQRISFAEGEKNKNEIGLIILSGGLVSLAISIICLFSGLILANFLPNVLQNEEIIDYKVLISAFKIALIATSINLFTFSLSGSLLGLQQTLYAGIARNLAGVIGIASAVILLFKGYGLFAIPNSNIVRAGVLLIGYLGVLIIHLKNKGIILRFNWIFFKSFTKIFSYTFFSKLFVTLANNIDLIIVARFIDVNTVTIFELTRRPLKFLKNFINLPSIAMLPAIANLSGEGSMEKLRHYVNRYLKIYSWVLFVAIACYIMFNNQLVNLWLDSKYYLGNKLNLLIAVTFIFSSLSYNLSNINYALGDIKGNSLINILYSAIYLILVYLMGKYFNIQGVILTPLVANLLTYFWYFPKKIVKTGIQTFSDIKKVSLEICRMSILCLSSLLVFIIPSNFNWSELFLYTGIYLVALGIGTYLVSRQFRLEISKLIDRIRLKV